MKSVYLDHNATTPLRVEARDALVETLDRLAGNPSSVHAGGREARMLLDEARERVAAALGVLEDEILFTSGGTEADNLAMLGGVASLGSGASIVTTAVEHPAVLTAARQLESAGHPLHIAPVDSAGRLDVQTAISLATQDGMVAAMAANSEVGTLTDLVGLSEGLRSRFGDKGPRLFTDAVQAIGRIPVNLRGWNVDFASFSAHKIGGPCGIGCLFRRQGTPLEPMLWGGGQEGGLRAGTENVAGIVAASVALALAIEEQAEYATRVGDLLHKLWGALVENIPDIVLNGPELLETDRLPNTLNVRLPAVEGPVLVTKLDLLGLQTSAGSACASGSLEPSTVLRAMGQTDLDARSGLRLSLGRSTTEADINTAVDILTKIVGASRNS